MKYFIGIFLILTFSSFQIKYKPKVIKGDLYYSNFSTTVSYYGIPDSLIQKVEQLIDTLNIEKASLDLKINIEKYKSLKETLRRYLRK